MLLSAHVYTAVVNIAQPKANILEIGAFEGEGTAALAQRYTDHRIYVIDPFIEDGHTIAATNRSVGQKIDTQYQAFQNNTKSYSNITLFAMTSKEFLSQSQRYDLMEVDTVIIDGSHHYDDVKIDIDIALRCIQGSGTIIFDDICVSGVEQAIKEFEQEYQQQILDRCLFMDACLIYKL